MKGLTAPTRSWRLGVSLGDLSRHDGGDRRSQLGIVTGLGVKRRFSHRTRIRQLLSRLLMGWRARDSRRDSPNAEHEVHQKWLSSLLVDLLEEHGLQKDQLLKPDGVLGEQVELFKTDVLWAGVGGDSVSNDPGPAGTKAELEDFDLQPVAARDLVERATD